MEIVYVYAWRASAVVNRQQNVYSAVGCVTWLQKYGLQRRRRNGEKKELRFL